MGGIQLLVAVPDFLKKLGGYYSKKGAILFKTASQNYPIDTDTDTSSAAKIMTVFSFFM